MTKKGSPRMEEGAEYISQKASSVAASSRHQPGQQTTDPARRPSDEAEFGISDSKTRGRRSGKAWWSKTPRKPTNFERYLGLRKGTVKGNPA